jgi:hypothetical protein
MKVDSLIVGVCRSRAAWISATGRGSLWSSPYEASAHYGDPVRVHSPKLAQLSQKVDAPPCVYEIQNGVFHSPTPYHFSENGVLFLDTVERYAIPYSQSDVWHLSAERREHFSGSIANAVCHGYFNLYHFLTDLLPRVWLIKQSPIKVDRWLIPADMPSWGRDLLSLAGVRDDELLVTPSGVQVVAERAVTADPTGAATWPSKWVKTALDNLFPDPSTETASQRLWISRSRAKRRLWTQEAKAIAGIEAAGFNRVNMEELSIEAQISLARSSAIVAGPHGAGLSWMLLSRSPDGLLFEVADDDLVQNSFRALAGIAGWTYSRSGSSSLAAGSGNAVLSDISRPANLVLRELDEALRVWNRKRT